jgi:thiol-disulfide isomerase/thioredoxin
MKRTAVVFLALIVVMIPPSLAVSEEKFEKLPNFKFIPLDGGDVVDLESFEGKVVLLNFWASWCGPCRIELPEFQQLYDALASRGFELVTVNLDHAPMMGRRFLEQSRLAVPAYTMSENDLQILGVRSLPTTILLDQERQPVYLFEGYSPGLSENLHRLILELLTDSDEQGESAA